MRMYIIGVSAMAIAGCATIGADGGEIAISRPIVASIDQIVPGAEVAAYAQFANSGSDDRLIAVECDCAERVEIHHIVSGEDGRKMVAEPYFDIPAGASVAITPPGTEWHMMLREVRRPIPVDSAIVMTLHFEHSPPQIIRFRAVSGTVRAWEYLAK